MSNPPRPKTSTSTSVKESLKWEDLKPNLIYRDCSTQGIDMATRRAQLRFNIHEHCKELLNPPDRYFHPIWYNLREDRSVDTKQRRILERQMLNDILDAIAMYDIYSGSVSVFLTHNGQLPSKTQPLPENIHPISYITPRTLSFRTTTENYDFPPFALILQSFVYTFVIPHVKLHDYTCQSIGYSKPNFSIVTIDPKHRKWPSLTEYDTEVFFTLAGWGMDEIPANVSSLLQEIYPTSVLSNPTVFGPMSPPTSTPRAHFDLSGRLRSVTLDEEDEDGEGNDPPSPSTSRRFDPQPSPFHSPKLPVSVFPSSKQPSIAPRISHSHESPKLPTSIFLSSRLTPSPVGTLEFSSSTVPSSSLSSSSNLTLSRNAFLESELAVMVEEKNNLLGKVRELEEQVAGLQQRIREDEALLRETLEVNEDEKQALSGGPVKKPFGTRTTQFLVERGLPFEINRLFYVLTSTCSDQTQWPALLMEQYPTILKKELNALIAAITFDHSSRRLKSVSTLLGGQETFNFVNKSS